MENVLSKLKEQMTIWESIDTRKVSNRCEKTVTQSIISQIETGGVTTEQLAEFAKKYPVFFYKTQVTLHGLFPEMGAYSHGYKNLIRNQNGSLGVKYSAIDAAKKKWLASLCSVVDVHSYRNSTEFYVYRSFGGREVTVTRESVKANDEKAREWAATIDKSLFTGSVAKGFDPLTGAVYIFIYVNSLPEKNVVPLAENITGKTVLEIEAIRIQQEADREAYWAAYKIKSAAENAQKEAAMQEKISADTRPDFDPSMLSNGQGAVVEVLSTDYWFSGFRAVWKDKKSGELREYKLDRPSEKDDAINMRKKGVCNWKKWQEKGAIKLHRLA